MAGGFTAAAQAKMQEKLENDDIAEAEVTFLDGTPSTRVALSHGIVRDPEDSKVWIMAAPIRLFKHLMAMKTELQEKKNVSAAERLVTGMKFLTFREHICAVAYKGIPIYDLNAPIEEEKTPYVKIIGDVCRNYKLSKEIRDNLENAKLCGESNMINFDISFQTGKEGIFYYGKFLAANIEGKIDFCFMFYRLEFQLAPDTIETIHANKWLCFTTKVWKTTHLEDLILSTKDLENFQNFFRLRMFDLLGGEIRGLADTEPSE